MKPSSLTLFALTVVIISLLSTATYCILKGSYETLIHLYPASPGSYIIYDRGSSTPFTGLVPLSLLNLVGNVSLASPETIAPVLAMGEAFFLRGVEPRIFKNFSAMEFLEGGWLEDGDLYAVVLGYRLARRLKADVGGSLTLASAVSRNIVTLRVKGVFRTNTPLDDEALSVLEVGQILRGCGYGYATLIRVRPREEFSLENLTTLLQVSEQEKQPQTVGWKTLVQLGIRPGRITVRNPEQFISVYLERYGVSFQSLLLASLVVLGLSTATVALAYHILLQQNSHELSLLRCLGLSEHALKSKLILVAIAIASVASILGTLLGHYLMVYAVETLDLRVLTYGISTRPDPLEAILALATLPPFLTAVIAKSRLENG